MYGNYYSNDGSVIPMQYTGLKDKNDTEIYEGDIVKFDENTIAEVFWDTKSVGWSWRWGKYNSGMLNPNCEVIGNIYENKDLL